jgi:hypothetical protein
MPHDLHTTMYKFLWTCLALEHPTTDASTKEITHTQTQQLHNPHNSKKNLATLDLKDPASTVENLATSPGTVAVHLPVMSTTWTAQKRTCKMFLN